MMHKVSIIVPVYKVEKYLCTCVDSIIGQTYKNIQLILVDDGSPDRCGAMCDEYADKDARVLSLHKCNGGVSSARNLGLAHAEGEYVTFCDSDDWYRPDWIEKLVEAMETSRTDLVLGNFDLVTEDGGHISYSGYETGVYELGLPEEKIRYCFETLLTEKHSWAVTNRLFSMELIRRHQISFCETCEDFAEDMSFTLSYSVFAKRIVAIEDAGYLYRMRGNSMTHVYEGAAKLNAHHEVFLFFVPACRRAFPEETAEKVLPIFHFLIMRDQYIVVLRKGEYHKMAGAVAQIRCQEEWKYWTGLLMKRKRELTAYFGKYNAQRILLLIHFCRHGNGLRFKIERRLFYMLKNKMEDCYGNGS